MTSLELLRIYQDMTATWLTRMYGDGPGDWDEDTAQVMTLWDQVLTGLEHDPMTCSRQVDWVAKLTALEGFRSRDGLDWSDPRLRAIDIQWSDVRADKGLFHRMSAAGRFDALVSEEEVRRAVTAPPEDTRAYFRGQCLARFPDQVAAASWDSVIFDVPGMPSLQRVPMLEPERGTKAHVGELMERARSADELLRSLAVVD